MLNLQYPLGSYSVDNPPSNETLIGDLNAIQTDVNAVEDEVAAFDLATQIHAGTNKTTPVDADELPLWDSVTLLLNKVTWANLKATLKTYFDTLYASVTNPTIAKPTLNGSVQGTQSYSPGIGATATIDLSLANRNLITMPAGVATIALSNATVGQIFTIDITQDGVGSRTVTWFTTIRWSGGSAPTLTTTASKRDSFIFVCTGTGTYDGYVIGFNV